jgi:hypothetical protein
LTVTANHKDSEKRKIEDGIPDTQAVREYVRSFGVRRLDAAFIAWPTRRPSRAACSGAWNRLDAFWHSTATSRLRKARPSPRTPNHAVKTDSPLCNSRMGG